MHQTGITEAQALELIYLPVGNSLL